MNMMNVITRGVRNAFRNVIRTGSLVVILGLSIGLALSMLIAYQAVGNKILTVTSSVGNTVSVSPAGVRGFEGGGTALTETQLNSVSSLAHVTGVNETLSDRVTTSDTNLVSAVEAGALGQRFANRSGQSTGNDNGGGMPPAGAGESTGTRSFTPPITVVGTTKPSDLSASSAQGGGTFTLKSGKLFSATATDNVAVIGSTLASKNNLTIGSTFTAYNTTITVIGIFDAGNSFSNNQVLLPLKTLQTLSAQPGAITNATLNVDSVENVDSVTAAAAKKLGSAADVTNAAAQAKTTIAPLRNIQTISLYSLVGAIIAGAVIILMTMIMIVRERRREIGVLKAIGASNARVVGQFMAEALTLTTLGAVVGVVIGVLAGNPITKLLVTNSTSSTTGGGMPGGPGRGMSGVGRSLANIHAAIGWEVLLYGFGAALLIAVLGSALASFAIAKIRPADVMRTE